MRSIARFLKHKRSAFAAGVLVVGIVAYLLFWWRENHGRHPAYGDVATWLSSVAAWLAAGGAAIAAYFAFRQLGVLRTQSELQAAALNRQAAELIAEGEARRKQAALVDEQLVQAREANLQLVRAQANAVNFFFTATAGAWTPRGLDPVEGGFHIAVVGNGSQRPIRDVICHISVQADTDPMKADVVARYLKGEVASHHEHGSLQDIANSDRLDLMRVGEQWAFVFGYPVNTYRGAKMSVTFTDDVGVRWRIDHALHLERLDTPPA